MFDRAQATSRLDSTLVYVTRMLALAADEYDLPLVKMLAERRDELLDDRLALCGK